MTPRPADRCPGVLTTHAGADGALARVRLPGGRITPAELDALADIAERYGDGHLEITSRANIQLRGVHDSSSLADSVAGAGLLPSPAHERVRNLAVSSLTGRIGGRADVWPIGAALDAAILADPQMSGLPGKFWFGVDDGHGDVVSLGTDLTYVAEDPGRGVIAVAGLPRVDVASSDAVAALVAAARHFVDIRADRWRVSDLNAGELADLTAAITEITGTSPSSGSVAAAGMDPSITIPASEDAPLVGWFDQDDGRVLLGGVVEHARLPARLAHFLAAVDRPVILTPRREILVCDLDEGVAEAVVRVLAPMGMIYDARSPWARLTSCVGAPGCASALAPVRDDLAQRASTWVVEDGREHWVGCARACGRPRTDHTLVLADPDGYRRIGSVPVQR